VSLRTLRSDKLKSINLHELTLKRRGDVVGHRVRTGAGIIGLHLDHWIVHGGQIIHRKPKVGEHAKEDHSDRQHSRHYRSADEWLRQIHDWPPTLAVPELSFAAC